MTQNQIQNPASIFCGQGRLWVGESFEALTEVGLIRNLKINHKIKIQKISVDGAPDLKYYQDGKKYSLEFEIGEITPAFWQKVNRNLVEVDEQDVTLKNTGLLTGGVARFRYTNADADSFTLDLENVTNIKTLGIELASERNEVAFQEVELEGEIVNITDQINL